MKNASDALKNGSELIAMASTAQVTAPAATESSASTTAPAPRPAGEQRSGELLLVEGYVFLWLLLMGWLFFVWRKQATLHSRLDELEKVIAAAEKKSRS